MIGHVASTIRDQLIWNMQVKHVIWPAKQAANSRVRLGHVERARHGNAVVHDSPIDRETNVHGSQDKFDNVTITGGFSLECARLGDESSPSGRKRAWR